MKNNTNTTLELPEGSKATIQGKVINGKNYLVVEVENEEQKEPEWKNFKRGDVLVRVGEESITDLVNSIKFEVSECVESIIEQAVKNYQLQLYVDSMSEQHEGVLRGEL